MIVCLDIHVGLSLSTCMFACFVGMKAGPTWNREPKRLIGMIERPTWSRELIRPIGMIPRLAWSRKLTT